MLVAQTKRAHTTTTMKEKSQLNNTFVKRKNVSFGNFKYQTVQKVKRSRSRGECGAGKVQLSTPAAWQMRSRLKKLWMHCRQWVCKGNGRERWEWREDVTQNWRISGKVNSRMYTTAAIPVSVSAEVNVCYSRISRNTDHNATCRRSSTWSISSAAQAYIVRKRGVCEVVRRNELLWQHFPKA